MPRTLFIGTGNKGKITEIRDALGDRELQLLTPADWADPIIEPAESGDTFLLNALAKARHYHAVTQLPTIADDSGIFVEALRGELGTTTRRWGAGPTASDHEWIMHFLSRMRSEENRRARFVCVIAYIDADGREHTFEGSCHGSITDTLEAEYLPGLPISACFKPDGCETVFSALLTSQKHAISHRGRALQSFIGYLDRSA